MKTSVLGLTVYRNLPACTCRKPCIKTAYDDYGPLCTGVPCYGSEIGANILRYVILIGGIIILYFALTGGSYV